VFCLEAKEEGEDPQAVLSGMFSVNAILTKVLFDAGATHSFINPANAKQMAYAVEEMDVHLCVSTPVGSVYQTHLVVWNCSIIIQDRLFFANLVGLGIRGYDVILGMDWLTKYQDTVDCKQKTLALVIPKGDTLSIREVIPTIPFH